MDNEKIMANLATFVFRSESKDKKHKKHPNYNFVESDECISGDLFQSIKKAAKKLYNCDAEITAEHFNFAEIKCSGRNFEVFKVDCIMKK